MLAPKQNDLISKSKYEKIDVISNVQTAEWETSNTFQIYFSEMMQNYKRVAGYLLSAADLQKLNIEERPKFIYNLLLPTVLQLAGNFLNNQSRVEALPRTAGDGKMSQIMTDLIDYAHYGANNLPKELATAFVNAIIGRVGWVYQEWAYGNDEQGMIEIINWDPFRVMWEPGFRKRNMRDCNYLINRGWYTPEEIRTMYALDKDDLYDEITEKAKLYLGTTQERNRKLVPYLERTFGPMLSGYSGKDQGYDEVSLMLNGMLQNSGNYFDGSNGTFKVVEFHERRQEKHILVYNPINNERLDITKAVESVPGSGKVDQNKVAFVREQFYQRYGIAPEVTKQHIQQIYQTAVCPAMNLVLYEAPYHVQNGNFKLTPVFCFDFGPESLDWKSYIDHLIDPVSALNLRMNSMQTYLLKVAAGGETWAEESALGEHESAFLENKINALKYVKDNKLDKVKNIPPPALPTGLLQDAQLQEEMMKKISTVRDNAMGTSENSNESGKLYQSRVAQADLMQTLVQDNAILQMKQIGENTRDYLLYYMDAGRVIRIVQDETNPYWMTINQEAITKMFMNKETGQIEDVQEIPGNFFESKYDIILSKAPFGEAAKEREFQELIMLTEIGLKINPNYVRYEYLVKNSRIRSKDEWLAHIAMIDQNMAIMNQQAQAQQAMQSQQQGQQQQLAMQEQQLGMQNQQFDLEAKKKDAQTEEFLQTAIMDSLTE